VRIKGSNAGYTMFRGSVKSTGYPLHSPVSPLLPHPCITVCHHISTGHYIPDHHCKSEDILRLYLLNYTNVPYIFRYTAHGLTIVILEITEDFTTYGEICYRIRDVRPVFLNICETAAR